MSDLARYVETDGCSWPTCGLDRKAHSFCRPECLGSDASDAVRTENNKLCTAIEIVVGAFEKDEAQGFHSKDRQFAIDILRMALPQRGTP